MICCANYCQELLIYDPNSIDFIRPVVSAIHIMSLKHKTRANKTRKKILIHNIRDLRVQKLSSYKE